MRWFERMNNTGGAIDVWLVDGVDPTTLIESQEGYLSTPSVVPPAQLTLRPASQHRASPIDGSGRQALINARHVPAEPDA